VVVFDVGPVQNRIVFGCMYESKFQVAVIVKKKVLGG
jgi:hypothetical protein